MAVEAKIPPKDQTGSGNMDNMVVCDVDTDYTGRFAVVSSEKKSSSNSNNSSSNKKSSFILNHHQNKNQFSKELKIGGDEAVDQVATDMFQVIIIIIHL